MSILTNRFLNRGAGFTDEEREKYSITGLCLEFIFMSHPFVGDTICKPEKEISSAGYFQKRKFPCFF